jgi:hypothetical protein
MWQRMRELAQSNEGMSMKNGDGGKLRSDNGREHAASGARSALHHHGFVRNWGQEMFVEIIYYFILV